MTASASSGGANGPCQHSSSLFTRVVHQHRATRPRNTCDSAAWLTLARRYRRWRDRSVTVALSPLEGAAVADLEFGRGDQPRRRRRVVKRGAEDGVGCDRGRVRAGDPLAPAGGNSGWRAMGRCGDVDATARRGRCGRPARQVSIRQPSGLVMDGGRVRRVGLLDRLRAGLVAQAAAETVFMQQIPILVARGIHCSSAAGGLYGRGRSCRRWGRQGVSRSTGTPPVGE